MTSKDAEIAAVATELDSLLDDLAGSVAALAAILEHPAPPPEDEAEERLVSP